MKFLSKTRIALLLALPLVLQGLHAQPAADPEESPAESPAESPVLSISQAGAATNQILEIDLTALGTIDWIIWGEWVGESGFEYDRKSGNPIHWGLSFVESLREDGEARIGTASKIGGEDVGFRFRYTDGSSVVGEQSNINEGIGLRIGNSRGSTPAGDVTLSVGLSSASGSLHLFISGNNAVPEQTLTATIADQSVVARPGWGYEAQFLHYKIDFSGVKPGSVLEVKWEADGNDYNSSLIMNACALQATE